MEKFAESRQLMVDCQIRTRDVTDHNVITAFLEVPREEFAAGDFRQLAYTDADVPVTATVKLIMWASFHQSQI